MKNAIIVHGKPTRDIYYSEEFPSSSNFAWIPWLQKQLITKDIKTDTPEMPFAFESDYEIWKTEFERFDVDEQTTLIGHSAGGGFLLRWFTENKEKKIDKLILVAPSIDPDKNSKTGFCNFVLEKNITARTNKTIIVVSDQDSEGVLKSVDILKNEISDIQTVVISGLGHFIPDHMNGSLKFPELRDLILKN